ncbi:MAG: GNAT family N-acetyltransferase [Anaerolineaceae bacterium]|jgi:ribosomal protein S18 acetylase RimI-like enzyme
MQNAFGLLNQDYYLNYPIINALQNGAELLGVNQDSVALLFPNPDFLLLAGSNPLELVKDRPRPDLALVCGSKGAAAVAAHFKLHGILECDQLYYPYSTIDSDLELEPLRPEDAGFVLKHYHRLSPEEIKLAISEERMFGLRDKGQLFAFIGLHEDHSMGMLEVLPKYRRQGWGERLERALIAKLLAMGELPYGHVVVGNEISMHLQKKLGFVLCSDKIFWMWKEESTQFAPN